MRYCLFWAGLLGCVWGALACPAIARAEDTSGRTALGLESGLIKLTGGDWDYSNAHPFLDLDLRRGLSPHWSLEMAFKYGWVRPGARPGEDAGFTTNDFTSLCTVIWQPRLGLIWHAAPSHRVSPFLGLAAGVTSWRVKNLFDETPGLSPGGVTATGFDEDGKVVKLAATDPTGTVSAGLDLFVSSRFAFSLGARYHVFPGNQKDNIGYTDFFYGADPAQVDANTAMIEGFLGMRLWFGSSDRDGDGVPNRLDRCPNEPEDRDGFQDEDGCPDPDNDKDGIVDTRDKCPNEAEDKDGFQDDDGCPDLDNDKDGIADTRDSCPDDPEDVDGFQDDDGCPDPDNDGDGVLDGYDKCTDTPAGTQVDDKGCPLVRAPAAAPPPAPAVREIRGDLILEGVNFLTGSAELTPASVEIVKEVARSLQAYPEIVIEIRGHTDDAGPAEANRDLSQRRALTVRDQLIRLGISPTRLTAVGFGEDFPIADNRTPDGRARNRRVELHRLGQ